MRNINHLLAPNGFFKKGFFNEDDFKILEKAT